ncbi:hypothetical protein NDU88_008640 [Pleurodeles waltl]|uniref:Uncharacterized protein n=1 Tax=Pleurodeles waltl TaxID=8319 RepID=A0AAV7PS69_PLEWA|nr:hypothetical protein NDU88_008640 [Pleurodeles waltl]
MPGSSDSEDDMDDDNKEGTVHVLHAMQPEEGHSISLLIDTGAFINIMVQPMFQNLPYHLALRPTAPQGYAFGSSAHLPLASVFMATITYEDQAT